MKRALIVSSLVLTAGLGAYSFQNRGFFSFWGYGKADVVITTPAKPGKTMRAFASESELKEHFKKFQETQRGRRGSGTGFATDGAVSNTAAQPAPSAAAKSDDSKAGKDEDSITNTQHAGVDEGGIVKVHGDHLVILRRGRLFTVRIGGNALEAESSINAYPPHIDPSNDWYDEMLVSNDTVVVIGYSYGRGGTEINLFDINSSGGLKYRSTYHLRSNDYYSSRNYASRLIGDKLIFYTPEYMGSYYDAQQQFPAVRKWHKKAKDNEFKTVVGATDIYRAERPADESSVSALHTVTICDLASKEMTCHGTAVLGTPGRVFYVSPKSVYVWTSDWQYGTDAKQQSMLYKLPLDGSAPSAVGVAGGPVDQFSFLESEGEQINVLVRSEPRGEQMWGSEKSNGDTALFRLAADKFGDGSADAERNAYLDIANVEGYTMQNRFVGDYVLYGSGNGWGSQKKIDGANLFAVNWKTGKLSNLNVAHSVDRIEQLGSAAIIVGTNGSDLYFSPVRLDDGPAVYPSYVRKGASQGELRSHGFFYKADGGESGILGLPIAREGREGYRHLDEDSAAIIFLKNRSLNFNQLGELEAHNATAAADGCKASCVDWYGNARPIFLRGRIFALLGYEIVEGKLKNDRLRELRRVNYTPNGWWPNDDRTDEEEE